MPKGNPGRLKDRFEIHGGLVPNEHEYQQQHGEMTEEEHENFPPSKGQGGKSAGKRGGAAKVGAKKSSAKKSAGKGAGKSAKAGAGKKSSKRR